MSSTVPLEVDTSEGHATDAQTTNDDTQAQLINASASPIALSALVHQTVELLSGGVVDEAVKHPDFHKLTPTGASTSLSQANQDALSEAQSWLTSCPVHSKHWIIFEARLRPDVSTSSFHDFVSTVLLSHGFQQDMTSDDTRQPTGVYRRKIESSSVRSTSSLFQVPTHDVVFARVGVSSSKLRVLRVFVGVTGGSGVPTPFLPLTSSADAALHATADSIFAHLQAAIVDVGYALAILSSPSFCDGSDDPAVALDEDYVKDVTAMFDTEMKATLRQLSLPLEEYAHAHEVATAHLLSLVEPLFVKFHIDKPQPPRPALTPTKPQTTKVESHEDTVNDGTSRGQRVTHLVHALWQTHRRRVSAIVDGKVREKQAQIARRVEHTKHLRRLAIQCILNNTEAKAMLQAAIGSAGDSSWEGAVLYEGSCILGKIPAKFFVTYDRLVFKTGMFMFASCKDIAFSSIARVTKPHVLGISVISLHTRSDQEDAEVQLTLASDVDRVFELLDQICNMHNATNSLGGDRDGGP